MAIIGADRFHHGRIPGPVGIQGRAHGHGGSHQHGRPPGPVGAHLSSALAGGGLNLGGCSGVYRAAVEAALWAIERARLPGGVRPVLTGEVAFVQRSLTVRTNVTYGKLPLGNETAGDYDSEGHLVVAIKLTSLDFIGTKELKSRPAHGRHAAVRGHPALPATYEDGTARIFEMALAHELGHAARIIRHQTFPAHMVEEQLVSNLENQYRFARGVPQRKYYGDAALKQYR